MSSLPLPTLPGRLIVYPADIAAFLPRSEGIVDVILKRVPPLHLIQLSATCGVSQVLHSLCKDIVDSAWARTDRETATDGDDGVLIAREKVEALCHNKQNEFGWK